MAPLTADQKSEVKSDAQLVDIARSTGFMNTVKLMPPTWAPSQYSGVWGKTLPRLVERKVAAIASERIERTMSFTLVRRPIAGAGAYTYLQSVGCSGYS